MHAIKLFGVKHSHAISLSYFLVYATAFFFLCLDSLDFGPVAQFFAILIPWTVTVLSLVIIEKVSAIKGFEEGADDMATRSMRYALFNNDIINMKEILDEKTAEDLSCCDDDDCSQHKRIVDAFAKRENDKLMKSNSN